MKGTRVIERKQKRFMERKIENKKLYNEKDPDLKKKKRRKNPAGGFKWLFHALNRP